MIDSNEIETLVAKIQSKTGYVPGIDQALIRKCLQAITALHDNEIDEKIKFLTKFI